MAPKIRHAKRFRELPRPHHATVIDEIRSDSQSDRAVAIIGAGYVDLVLLEAITGRFERPDPEVIKTLFDENAPLQSFGARIQLGYLMGLYADGVLEDLRAVKAIRNAFAHGVEPLGFDNMDVARLVGQFNFPRFVQFSGRPKPSTSRALYVNEIELLTDCLLTDISRRIRGTRINSALQFKGRRTS